MRWQKRGRLLRADGQRPWMYSHTATPIPLVLDEDHVRIYFGTRDANNRPYVGFADFDVRRARQVGPISSGPALGPGPAGHFDDNGVYPGPILTRNGQLWMYYLGRSNGADPLYYMAIGLAVSEDGGTTFQRARVSPVMSRGEHDPWMVSTPFVLEENGRLRMWYLSGLRWDLSRDPARSYYHIKYAESADGLEWRRDGLVCIDFTAGETNISSPTVLRGQSGYHMWYSRYADGYRIGYAESTDGRLWVRHDDRAGIELSDAGWDSESMAYPAVFACGRDTYLLYSGNGLGREGLGIAVSE